AGETPLALAPGAAHFFHAQLRARPPRPQGWGKARGAFLLELPPLQPPPRALFEGRFRLQIKGLKIVLAHPERYSDPERWIGDVRARGVLWQGSLASLGGKVGQTSTDM